MRRLPEDTQEVLRVASAGSGVTSDALLSAVTGLDADELTAAIRPAVAANVLVTSADGYSFRHALIREAVHADLLPGERAGVHTRFAPAIDADPALVSGRADIEKAHHWYSAHNTTGALASAWQAAVQAGRRRARGAAGAARPGPRTVGAGAGRRGADRRRPRAGAGGGRRPPRDAGERPARPRATWNSR